MVATAAAKAEAEVGEAAATTTTARWQRVKTKKGQSGSGEPDCSQRDLIMNHNERARARISAQWSRGFGGETGLTFIYAKRQACAYMYVRACKAHYTTRKRKITILRTWSGPKIAAVAIVSVEQLVCNSFRYQMFDATCARVHLSPPRT